MGFGFKKPDDAAGAAAPAIIIGLFVAFGGVLFGYDSSLLLDLADTTVAMTPEPSEVS